MRWTAGTMSAAAPLHLGHRGARLPHRHSRVHSLPRAPRAAVPGRLLRRPTHRRTRLYHLVSGTKLFSAYSYKLVAILLKNKYSVCVRSIYFLYHQHTVTLVNKFLQKYFVRKKSTNRS